MSSSPYITICAKNAEARRVSVFFEPAVHFSAAPDCVSITNLCCVFVSAAIDNLGKGAASQAIQNANLVVGIAENSGLSAVGIGS